MTRIASICILNVREIFYNKCDLQSKTFYISNFDCETYRIVSCKNLLVIGFRCHVEGTTFDVVVIHMWF
jgi:hypothetical protein